MVQGQMGLLAGYRLLARVQREDAGCVVPTQLPLPGAQSFLVGTDCGPYTLPIGIDPLELGLIVTAGHYDLLPIDPLSRPRRHEARPLFVSEQQAAEQRAIWKRSYEALLAVLPDDAEDIERDVHAHGTQGAFHPCLEALSRSTTDTWCRDRDPTTPLDDVKRERLRQRIAARTLMLLRQEATPCRLDGWSMRLLSENLAYVLLDRIDLALEEGRVEDALARALARYRMGLHVPPRFAAALLLRTRRLDIGFFIARRTLQPLELLAAIDPVTPDVQPGISSAQAVALVRAMYAVFESVSVRREWSEAFVFQLRWRLTRIADVVLPPFDEGLRSSLARRLGGRTLIGSVRMELTVPESLEILQTATAALHQTLAQIIDTLPERAADGTLT